MFSHWWFPWKFSDELCMWFIFADDELQRGRNEGDVLVNFRCMYDGCGKQFAFKSQLGIHLRSHTGEQPFQCYLCHRKFTQCNNLYRHLKTSKTCSGTDKWVFIIRHPERVREQVLGHEFRFEGNSHKIRTNTDLQAFSMCSRTSTVKWVSIQRQQACVPEQVLSN
jgi:hypothetical protein